MVSLGNKWQKKEKWDLNKIVTEILVVLLIALLFNLNINKIEDNCSVCKFKLNRSIVDYGYVIDSYYDKCMKDINNKPLFELKPIQP